MIKLYYLIKIALKSIKRNRMRSLLTILGIIIGVASVIDMVAVGRGAQKQIEEQIISMGSNVILILPGAASQQGLRIGSRLTLTIEDVKSLEKEVSSIVYVAPVVRWGGQIIAGNSNWQTAVFGTTPNFIYIRDWKLSSGELFTEKDVQLSAKKALLGATVKKELFGDEDPVGAKIRIRNIPFTVIGVLAEKGQGSMGQNQDDIIVVPYTTVQNRLGSELGSRYLNQILVSIDKKENIESAQKEIEEVLRRNHKLYGNMENDFRIITQTEMISRANEMANVMTMLLGAIAGVSLIVGGIGIMNIMLVSVTERTKEIGIRMAVGANSLDIMLQFLAESMVLSIFGGMIGIILALLLAWIATNWIGLRTEVEPFIVILSFLFSAIIGIFFGFYPARKAASLNPVEALRYE